MASHGFTSSEAMTMRWPNYSDKNVVKTLIDAFITKGKIKQLVL